MTNHLKYIDVREYARVVDIARELIERAEQAEAAIQRVRELHRIDQCRHCAEFHCLECGCEGVYTEQVSCRTTRALDGAE